MQSKLPETETSIFAVMSKLASDYDAINLSQGFPNFDIDQDLAESLKRISLQNVHQYAPMQGDPMLLKEVQNILEKSYNHTVEYQRNLLITAGATQAIFSSITALISAGDEVILLDPCYDCYEAPVLLCGAIPIHIPLDNEYLPDWDQINAKVGPKTKMIIINNPHNPSGRIWSENDFRALEELALKHPQLVVLSDEVYEFISLSKSHLSIHHSQVLRERAIVVSSFGKTFHITGWKIGYLYAPSSLLKEILKVHQYVVFCVNSIAQRALSNYIQKVNLIDLKDFYSKKRDFFQSLLKESRFQILPSEGTYFQLLSYEDISKENDVAFAHRLTTEHGVASIPLSVFNKDKRDRKHVRFCFAKDDKTLIEAAKRLCKI